MLVGFSVRFITSVQTGNEQMNATRMKIKFIHDFETYGPVNYEKQLSFFATFYAREIQIKPFAALRSRLMNERMEISFAHIQQFLGGLWPLTRFFFSFL